VHQGSGVDTRIAASGGGELERITREGEGTGESCAGCARDGGEGLSDEV